MDTTDMDFLTTTVLPLEMTVFGIDIIAYWLRCINTNIAGTFIL